MKNDGRWEDCRDKHRRTEDDRSIWRKVDKGIKTKIGQ